MSIRHVLADQQIVAELTGRGVAVLIVSALGCPRHVRRMLHTGVAGVVAKSDSMDALRDAVSAALAGQKWMCPVLAQALVIDRDVDRPNLSDKELDCMRAGSSSTVSPGASGTVPSTAKQYIDRVRDKYAQVGHPARAKADL